MTPFKPDGVYAGIRYRVLPDASIEAMTPSGLSIFKDMDQLMASVNSTQASSKVKHSILPYDVPGKMGNQNTNASPPAKPLDYYSILLETIKKTERNSAQLRALVYERARFNFKRDVLFGHSSMGLADLVRHINDFELAVARIEANSLDGQHSQPYREQTELLDTDDSWSSNAVQILPQIPASPLYAGLSPNQRAEDFQHGRRPKEFVLYARNANLFIGIFLLGLVLIGTAIVVGTLWRSSKVSPPIEIANNSPKTGEAAVKNSSPSKGDAGPVDNTPKVPFPLPASYGIYALSDNKLIELEALPISIPDPRVALSAEIKKPSTTTISDNKPAFILFRRDLLNNAPQKITLRVVARMARETKIVAGKPLVTKIEGAWRIRNIARELRVSPIAGQREMIIARPDDNLSLVAGRYALVLNRVGYDFTVNGPVKSPAHCLEGFETANGTVFSECRAP